MGIFEIPQVERNPAGWLYLILGILLGGVGTIIGGAVSGHKNSIWLGIIQIAASFVFGLGYIWAVIHCIIVFVKSS